MARPTKATVARARRLGRSPATLQGWLDRGYAPAEPLTSPREREHYDAVALATGPGHDPEVAFIKLAGAGHATAGLRAVLRDLLVLDPDEEDIQDADELLEHGMTHPGLQPIIGLLRQAAHSVGPPRDWIAHDSDVRTEPELADLTLGAALLPLAQTATGEELEPLDTINMGRLTDEAFVHRLGTPMPDDSVPEAAEFDLRLLQSIAVIAGRAERWLVDADPQELARGVQAADSLVKALEIIGVHFSQLGDEERWRTVGRIAPIALPTLRMLLAVYDVVVPFFPADDVPEVQRAFYYAIREMKQVLEARTT